MIITLPFARICDVCSHRLKSVVEVAWKYVVAGPHGHGGAPDGAGEVEEKNCPMKLAADHGYATATCTGTEVDVGIPADGQGTNAVPL
jgi:hypothetical protein